MHQYIVFDKKIGQTPLSVIESYKKDHPELRDVPMAYAGRLDPMASGKLLVLLGDTCKDQKRYQALDKQYDFELLLGISSDTGDVLGLSEIDSSLSPVSDDLIKKAVSGITGSITLPYPIYSSKTVQGKPLFLWSLEDRLSEIEIPTCTSKIYRLRYHGSHFIKGSVMEDYILDKIETIPPVKQDSKKLGADFRRNEIRKCWDTVLSNHQDTQFQIASFSVITSSGLYVRSLVPHLASLLGQKGLAYSIHRTHIGKYIPILGWIKRYT